VATDPGRTVLHHPDVRDRLYELLEHSHLPHSGDARFA
jgi:voltage-gated potassium channel